MDARKSKDACKVVQLETACREAKYSNKIREDSRSSDKGNIIDVISGRTTRKDSSKVEDGTIQQGHQQQLQELTTRT